ncbi:MAG: hypothetical protein DRG78_23815 [Epsilonproteobacteria bacterium]|nr:MAG: hypothetical protein DRG78_23815 [Campylobacterota bacterium]
MFVGLSLDQAPPFKAPLKFFLTAPLFAIVAGLLLLFSTEFTIHSPYLIATIHFITIGYMIMIVFGALQQMLPVIAGAVIPKPVIVANITYWSLIIGLISFSIGFFIYEKILFFVSAITLMLGILFFISVALAQLIKVVNKSYIVYGIIVSLVFLICAFFLGIHLLISHATSNISSLHYDFATLHYNFIFFGFLFLLIASVTFQVVPMFWVSADFKQNEQKIIIIGTAILLAFCIVSIFTNYNLYLIYKIVMSGVLLYFAYTTIYKLKNRRRKLQDYTVNFYFSSMIFLILGTFYWLIMDIFNLSFEPLAILFGLGFLMSLFNGMLYKIVPFLTWFHLNSQGKFNIPTMRDMIPSSFIKIQFYLHIVSIILFFFGFLINLTILIKLASIIFIISNTLFFLNLLKSANIYKTNL